MDIFPHSRTTHSSFNYCSSCDAFQVKSYNKFFFFFYLSDVWHCKVRGMTWTFQADLPLQKGITASSHNSVHQANYEHGCSSQGNNNVLLDRDT